MYKKWIYFTELHPYISILIVAIIASLIGISIEYIFNKDFVGGGFWVTLILVICQFIVVRNKKR